MATPSAARNALRANTIAGLLEYKPGPGIYSRLERAVQQLPENVRVQELPGLLKRYKDGIPGWELNAVDLNSVVAGRTVVPREELLAAVRERSPVYTHKEVVLGGKPQQGVEIHESEDGGFRMPVLAVDRQQTPSPLGAGVSHGQPKYENYGQGGDDYSEVLLLQPGAKGDKFDSHWGGHPQVQGTNQAVAHLRLDTHRDALRINELQSDLGIHNRKVREQQSELAASMPRGIEYNNPDPSLPFPLEDAWADILTKRAVLEAARQGHRAIEVASPRSIADKVGGNIDNYEHFYGKVVPGSLERLGRKMGGLTEDPGRSSMEGTFGSSSALDQFAREAKGASDATIWEMRRQAPSMGETNTQDVYRSLIGHFRNLDAVGMAPEKLDAASTHYYGNLYQMAVRDLTSGNMPLAKARKVAGEYTNKLISQAKAEGLLQAKGYVARTRPEFPLAGKRYTISDEMRKNIITKGIPAAVAIGVGTGLATGGNQAEAKPILPESDAVLRAAMPWQTQRKISRLTKQVDAAYEKGDFKTAEKLDAQREQLVDDWDNKLDALDEGDGNADFEPENYDQDSAWTDELANVYGRAAAAQSPTYGIDNDADLANALRGVLPDTARANQIPDADIIRYAKDSFEQRQSHLAKVRNRSPEDGVRAMQARLRELGAAPAVAAGTFTGKQDHGVPFGEFLVAKPAGGEEKPSRNFDFSMAISPGEWDAYYEQQAASGPSQDALDFRKNVAEVMQQPIIRVGAANDGNLYGGPGLLVDGEASDRITPAQFVNEYLDRFSARMPAEGRAQVLQAVQAKLDGSTRASDEMTDDIVGRMMTSLKASSPQGQYAKTDPMPQEQLDQLKAQHGDWAESMLTPGTAENFDSLRGYELLRTTLDGEHAPVYADSLSNAAAFVGGVVDPRSRQNFADATLRSGPEGRFSRANRDYFGSRQRPDEPAAFRNQDGSSRFAATSASNIQGLMRAGGDMSTTIGKLSWPLYESFSEFGRTPVGKAVTGEGLGALWNGSDESNFMAARRNAFDREQPIQPAGMSREEFDRQQASHKQDRAQGEAWGATTWPNVQNAIEQSGLMFSPRAWGGAPQPAQPLQKTWGPPAYNNYAPNFLQNTVGNIPSAGIMVGAAATGGLGGLAAGAFKPSGSTVRTLINAGMGLGKGAAKGVGTAVASQAADLPADTATDLGIGSTLAGPQNYINFLTTPESENALLPGVDPNAMSIDELNQRRSSAMDDREKKFRSDMWDWNKRPKNQYESAYEQWQRGQ
jgi:hypothetical protein